MTDVTEEWLPAPDYERFYEVSDWGRVRSLPRVDSLGRLHRGRVRRTQVAGAGYTSVGLSVDGIEKREYVHALVLRAFIGPCPPGMECLHGDDDKANNRLSNLSWGTHAANQRDSSIRNRAAFGARNGMTKLTEGQVGEIRALRAQGVRGVEIAERFGISTAQVSRIGQGRNWQRQPGADPINRNRRGSQHASARLTEDDVRAIRAAREAGAGSTELAKRYGVSQGTISSIVHRRIWSHVA